MNTFKRVDFFFSMAVGLVMLAFLGTLKGQESPSVVVARTNSCLVGAELRVTNTSLGSPLEGPYLPGEFVTFSYSITNYRTDGVNFGNQCQYLQAIIPVFGNGWDPASFRANGRPENPLTTPSDNLWNWLEEGLANYNFPSSNITVYQDTVFNRLAICGGNTPLCSQAGTVQGQAMPAGWYVLTNDARIQCDNPGVDPNDSYGIPQACNTNRGHGTFTFRLRARPYDGSKGCDETEFTDTSVEIFAFTDAQIGCFDGINTFCDKDLSLRFEASLNCIPTNTAARYYNNRAPICFSAGVNSTVQNMGILPTFTPTLWPGCSENDTLFSPNWFTFVATHEQMQIAFTPQDCAQGIGVKYALYRIPCEFSINPTGRPDPKALGPPITPCAALANPVTGRTQLSFSAYPGELFGLLIDEGSPFELCQMFIEVLNEFNLPLVSQTVLEAPSTDFSQFEFVSDTICQGAKNVLFSVAEVPGACRYEWTLKRNDDPTQFFAFESEKRFTFNEEGNYRICTRATNYCASTNQACRDFVVFPTRESVVYRDTICRGSSYLWKDSEGNTIKSIEPQNETGLKIFDELLDGEGLCSVVARLELFVREVNFDNPTPVNVYACYEDMLGGEGHVFFCDTFYTPGVYGPLSCVSPFTGCDTFFLVNFVVVGGPLDIKVQCDGNGSLAFDWEDKGSDTLYTPWKDQFSIFTNDSRVRTEWRWIAVSGPRLLSSLDRMVATDQVLQSYRVGDNIDIRMELDIFFEDTLLCFTHKLYRLSYRDNFATIPSIVGDDAYCLGDEGMTFFAEIRDPRNPVHNRPQDRVVDLLWTLPPGFSLAPGSALDGNPILINSVFDAPGKELCITATTDLCALKTEACLPLVPLQVPVEILGLDECGQFIFGVKEVEDFPNLTYRWTAVNGEILGSNSEPLAIVKAGSTDSTLIRVEVQGSCLGVGELQIPPQSPGIFIEDLEEQPRSVYTRSCGVGVLHVITEPGCKFRWGYRDVETGEIDFPVLGPDGQEWTEAFLDVNPSAYPNRRYFIERVRNCEGGDCQSEWISTRGAAASSCDTPSFLISPNPNAGAFVLKGAKLPKGDFAVEVKDIMGRRLYFTTFFNDSGNWERTIQLPPLVHGYCLVSVIHEQRVLLRTKVLVIP
jgi:hypothetical protein